VRRQTNISGLTALTDHAPRPTMRRRRFFLIANPGAGLTGSPLVDAVANALLRAGAELTLTQPGDIETARRQVREAATSARYDAILAAGGDGTIRQVSAALIGTGVALGIVPVGTGNVLAHEIGLVPEAHAIAGMLLRGPVIDAVCARANGEPFLLMAGAGFDGRVIAALDHRLKSHVGKAAYAGPMIGALAHPVDTLHVTVDGTSHEASWAVISNVRHYGGNFVLARRTGIRERGLQAILFKAKNRTVLLGQLMALATGTLDARSARHGDVEMLPCLRACVTAQNPVPTQIDGDAFGSTPLEIEAGAADLRLIVPATPALDLAR
jgi:diacylglycerol kinase family enzyme